MASKLGSSVYLRDRQQNIGSPLYQQLRTRQFIRDRLAFRKKEKFLYCADLYGHFGCVNAIEFSNNGGQLLASGGDDRRLLLWNLEKELSRHKSIKNENDKSHIVMKGEHNSNIFCVAFDTHNDRIFSGGNDDQVIVHDTKTKETVDVFTHEDAVYGLSSSPCDPSCFVSACADGRVLVWDLRVSTQDPFILSNYTSAFHAVVYHPLEPRFLATANAKEGVALWDIRRPRTCLMRYGNAYTQLNAMSVRFNMFGTHLLALRRRLPPVIYNVDKTTPLVEFDHAGYYNSCTMKSCSFAGDKDQYILSGSDDFNVFMWKVPDQAEEKQNSFVGEADLVLTGHRQIVNQVRFDYSRSIIASSGVEKIIKIWSPFQLPGMNGRLDNNRRMYTHQQYFELMINSNSALSHDYSEKSTEEDPHMLAFFDSLIQREVDRSFSSESEDSELSPASLYFRFAADTDDNSSNSESQPQPQQFPSISGDSEDGEKSPVYTNLNIKTSVANQDQKQSSAASSVRESSAFSDALDARTEPTTSEKHKKRPLIKDSSSSSESTETDESQDFYIMQFKNKFFRKVFHQQKRRRKFGVRKKGVRFKVSKSQEEKDRLTNLKQRAAFCQILKERIPSSSSDSDSDDKVPQINDEEFRTLSDQLNQRTEGARQRGAALRVKKLQISSDSLNPVRGFKIRVQDSEGTENNLQVNGHSTSGSNSNCHLDSLVSSKSTDNQSNCANPFDEGINNSECSTSRNSHGSQPVGQSNETDRTKEGLSSFKKRNKGTKRRYRSHSEHLKDDSDSD